MSLDDLAVDSATKDRKKRNKKQQQQPAFRTSISANPHYNNHRAHHATVQSLAGLNDTSMFKELTKVSNDLKLKNELQKALVQLKQKDDDYQNAIEIIESLTRENGMLKQRLESADVQVSAQRSDHRLMQEKLKILSQTYAQDVDRYRQDLQSQKELVHELTASLDNKEYQIVAQKRQLTRSRSMSRPRLSAQRSRSRKSLLDVNGADDDDDEFSVSAHDSEYGFDNDFDDDDDDGLGLEQLGDDAERQLFSELEQHRKQNVESQETIEKLVQRLDEMMELKRKYGQLKKENRCVRQMAKDEMVKHIEMQKSIEQEAIYLAARRANLEEERDELMDLLEQRDYEITMLNSQMQLLQTGTSIKGATLSDFMSEMSNNENDTEQYLPFTVGDSFSPQQPHMQAPADSPSQHSHLQNGLPRTNTGHASNQSDSDEIERIAEILDDATFNQELFGHVDDEETTSRTPHKRDRDQKAFDKIKEYLHLTASAVKIKYPQVKEIQSDALIKKVKQLPFYKYHDQMVRIMESELKKIEKLKQNLMQSPGLSATAAFADEAPVLTKRRSFLSIFNIFGGDSDKDKQSNNEEPLTTAMEQHSLSEEMKTDGAYASGSATPKRRRNKSKSYKKKRERSHSHQIMPNDDQLRYQRGSVQASQKRLKNRDH